MAGGLLLTGTSAASAANWSCPSGAACVYKLGTTTPSAQTWVDAKGLGSGNKVKNTGEADYYDKTVFYYVCASNGQEAHSRICLSRGSQKFRHSDHGASATVNRVEWVHSCP